MMKQKKRVWMSFNLWEANVFEQYLEEMAAQGWFLESVGGSVMKFHRAEPAKRRYAALLVPGSSSLTGADSWKAEQFRKQCQEAGWNFECSGTFWQIFYTTDDAVERTGDMTEEKQFLIQKSLSWTWSVKLCYPVLSTGRADFPVHGRLHDQRHCAVLPCVCVFPQARWL